jgi:hypothetical protein
MYVTGCEPNRVREDINKLNTDQKAAVYKALSAQDYALVLGICHVVQSTSKFYCVFMFAYFASVLIRVYSALACLCRHAWHGENTHSGMHRSGYGCKRPVCDRYCIYTRSSRQSASRTSTVRCLT